VVGYSSVSGTSASAAEVAGAAALLKANSPMATNGVIVNALAESATPPGRRTRPATAASTIDRAINDMSSTSIEPMGAPPVGNGGPFVGPYVAAANVSGQLQTQNNPPCSSGGIALADTNP